MLVIQSKKLTIKKICEIENKITSDNDYDRYITTEEINKLPSENFTARLGKANLASKSNIANFIKKTDLNKNELNLKKNYQKDYLTIKKKLQKYQQKD